VLAVRGIRNWLLQGPGGVLAQTRVASWTPAGTEIKATVYVLLLGNGNNVANDEGEVCLDLGALPPSDPLLLALPELAHELHHLGYAYWRNQDEQVQAVM